MFDINQLLENIDAVIFDVDGTLLDSMGIWKEVDHVYLSRYHLPVPENLQRDLAGLSILEAAKYFREVLGIDESNEKMVSDWNELAIDQYEHHVQMKESAMKWLQALEERQLPMAVGTSNTRKLALAGLNAHGLLRHFQVILTGEDVERGKPDPYIYLTAAKKLGVDPERCLVFEDIPAGIQAGLAAGMKVCAVWDAFSEYETATKKELANYYIDSFEDIFNGKIEVLR